MTTTRVIREPGEVASFVQLMKVRAKPFTVAITDGVKRTNPQNALQFKWCVEAAQQLGADDSEGYRAWCKLHLGVPILRNENEDYRAKYDRVVKPLPYETKLDLMREPVAFPVTSQMTVKQKSAYLDAVYQHFTSQGVALTQPEGRG